MKTITEYIQKKHIEPSKDYNTIYKNAIATNMQVTYQGITFFEFINSVTPEILAKTLKHCWQEATKDFSMGRFNYILDDGVFAVEIMTMPGIRARDGKWWREAFIKKENIKSDAKFVNSAHYMDYFHKAGENGACTFNTKWGDRLAKITPDYLEYLKEHYDALK